MVDIWYTEDTAPAYLVGPARVPFRSAGWVKTRVFERFDGVARGDRFAKGWILNGIWGIPGMVQIGASIAKSDLH